MKDDRSTENRAGPMTGSMGCSIQGDSGTRKTK